MAYPHCMNVELQALVERAYANDPEEAVALQRLIETFELPTERERDKFIAWFAAMIAPEAATLLPKMQSHG